MFHFLPPSACTHLLPAHTIAVGALSDIKITKRTGPIDPAVVAQRDDINIALFLRGSTTMELIR